MSQVPGLVRTAWRFYETDGVPVSGDHEPEKPDIFAAGDQMGTELDAANSAVTNAVAQLNALTSVGAGGVIGFPTFSVMNGDLGHASGTLARISYGTDPAHAGTYIKSGASGSGSWVPFPDIVDIMAPDIPHQVVVDLLASNGGAGTDASPYSPSDLQTYLGIDTLRRSLVITVRGDHFRGPTWTFDVSKWRSIEIRSVTGKNVQLLASRFVPSGSAAFTQPDSVNFPNVWMIDNFYRGSSGSTVEATGLIDIDSGQPCGLSGNFRSSVSIYTNIGNDLSLATMNSTTYRTGVSMQTTGTYAGKLLVHARASLNPNTINFEQAIYDYCLLFTSNVGTATNACKVKLTGITASYALAAGIWADRCEVEWTNLVSQFNVGYGYNPNQCWGVLTNCDGGPNQIDNFNGNGAIGDASALDRNVRLTLIGCRGLGCTQTLVPPTGGQQVGDCFSNHRDQTWNLIGCYAIAATKDGASMVDEFTLIDFVAEDCVNNGVTCVSQDGIAITSRMFGGRLTANTCGISVVAQTTSGSTAKLEVFGTVLDSNVVSSIDIEGAKPAICNAYGIRVRGPVPSSGHLKNGNTDGTSGTFFLASVSADELPAPVVTASTHTQTEGESSLIYATTATNTTTLLSASAHAGRTIRATNKAAFAINSASSNVVPLAGGSASAAILPATAGKWVDLKSNGTSWDIVAGN